MALNIPGTDAVIGGGGGGIPGIGPTTPFSLVNFFASTFGRKVKQREIDTGQARLMINTALGAAGGLNAIQTTGRANINIRNRVAGIATKFRTLGLQITPQDIDAIKSTVSGVGNEAFSAALGGTVTDTERTTIQQQIADLSDQTGGGRAVVQSRATNIGLLQQRLAGLPEPVGRAGKQARFSNAKISRRNAALDSIFSELETIFNQKKIAMKGVPQPGESDFVGPLRSQPTQPQGKTTKEKVGKAAIRTAMRFARFPRRDTRSSGFVRAGMGDISELTQDADRIIPSGFVSKQATTQNRAIALNKI